jgi:hypothetical protein
VVTPVTRTDPFPITARARDHWKSGVIKTSIVLWIFVPMNATASPVSLYAGIDVSSLSWLEKHWMAYYVWIGNPIIATGLMSFVVHEVCWLQFLDIFDSQIVFRLCISDVAYRGSSSMLSPTFKGGNYSRRKCLPHNSSGSAQSKFFFPISWWTCQL